MLGSLGRKSSTGTTQSVLAPLRDIAPSRWSSLTDSCPFSLGRPLLGPGSAPSSRACHTPSTLDNAPTRTRTSHTCGSSKRPLWSLRAVVLAACSHTGLPDRRLSRPRGLGDRGHWSLVLRVNRFSPSRLQVLLASHLPITQTVDPDKAESRDGTPYQSARRRQSRRRLCPLRRRQSHCASSTTIALRTLARTLSTLTPNLLRSRVPHAGADGYALCKLQWPRACRRYHAAHHRSRGYAGTFVTVLRRSQVPLRLPHRLLLLLRLH